MSAVAILFGGDSDDELERHSGISWAFDFKIDHLDDPEKDGRWLVSTVDHVLKSRVGCTVGFTVEVRQC